VRLITDCLHNHYDNIVLINK